MENSKKEEIIQEKELKNVNGGLFEPPLSQYHCNDCFYEFRNPTNNACPRCGSKNLYKRW